MRIEKINENKIKVLIDDKEAEMWNVSFKKISQNTPEAQRVLWTAIRAAEEHAHFSVVGAKLFVEAVEGDVNSKLGMLITRVANEEELNEAIKNCSYKGTLRRSRLNLGPEKIENQFVYKFRDFESVCDAAEKIYDIYMGESTLYKYNEEFYLHLIPRNTEISPVMSILAEFGECVKNCVYIHGRLNEYGETMIENSALKILQEYFCVSR